MTTSSIKPTLHETDEGQDFMANLNPNSIEVITAKVEPTLEEAEVGNHYQFLRKGYFAVDPDSKPDALVFNRTATLRDSWAKVEQSMK